jgi:hypothetical protein
VRRGCFAAVGADPLACSLYLDRNDFVYILAVNSAKHVSSVLAGVFRSLPNTAVADLLRKEKVSLNPLHDPLNIALELREQIASQDRRIVFFMGAGTSMEAGLPGLNQLTKTVVAAVDGPVKKALDIIQGNLGSASNIEDILSHVRILRELLGGTSKTHDGISGTEAKELDIAICQAIYKAVSLFDPKKITPHVSLGSWIRHVRRAHPTEIFTTNYDLVIEMAFEKQEIPYFDGFVGTIEPFLVPECVEADGTKQTGDEYPPRSWARLWKLHGSIGWRVKTDVSGNESIVRNSSSAPEPGTELVIYPSREKYVASRKLPFLTYMDRLRKSLTTGECLLLIVGYSFRDQHLNEILRQGLRANTRLTVNAFIHGDPGAELVELSMMHRNLSLYARKSACLQGNYGLWLPPSRKKQPGDQWPFWDEKNGHFLLGEFQAFAQYLDLIGGGLVASAVGPVATKP